jgi:TDG/mug DNA glycosylase family protein
MLLPNPTPTSAVLPDVLEAGLDLVTCGSAVGTASAMRSAYYAGPGNQFWHTLQTVGLTPQELSPRDFRSLLGFGIGLTDLVKSQAGNDADIQFGSFDRPHLEKAILHYRPRFLCFNGKRHGEGVLRHSIGRVRPPTRVHWPDPALRCTLNQWCSAGSLESRRLA